MNIMYHKGYNMQHNMSLQIWLVLENVISYNCKLKYNSVKYWQLEIFFFLIFQFKKYFQDGIKSQKNASYNIDYQIFKGYSKVWSLNYRQEATDSKIWCTRS